MSVLTIPPKLVRNIVKGKCVVFVGAGLSVGAGLPDWGGLLKLMIEWVVENGIVIPQQSELIKHLRNKEFLLVADNLENILRGKDLRDCLKSIFDSSHKPLIPKEAHLLLTRLPFYAALTTNYDRLLESAYAQERRVTPKQILFNNRRELGSLLNEDDFYILKTHGTIDDVETIILGKKSYSRLIHGEEGTAYKKHLEVLLSTKTFFFVGFSLTDPDLKLLMEKLSEVFKGHSNTHYALMDNTADKNTGEAKMTDLQIQNWDEHYNIKILPYETLNGDHKEVEGFLENLIARVNEAQNNSSPSSKTHSPKTITSLPSQSPNPPNGLDKNSQKSLWQNQLEELGTRVNQVLSSDDDLFGDLDKKLAHQELARLQLLTTTWLSSKVSDSFLGMHEMNYLYLERQKLALTRAEKMFMARMLLETDSDYVSGWFWLLDVSHDLVAFLALTDPLEKIRSKAFYLLSEANIPVSDFIVESGNRLRTISYDLSPEVRKAWLKYLGIVGTAEELQAIEQAEIDDDQEVRSEALISKYLIQLRINPSRTFEHILADKRVDIKNLFAEINKQIASIASVSLLKAIKHQDDQVRLFVVEELIRRNELVYEKLVSLKEDSSNNIRELCYRQLINRGDNLAPEDIYLNVHDESYARKYSRNFVLFNPSPVDPNSIICDLYRSYESEKLVKLTEWSFLLGHIAYKALVLQFFTENAAQLRFDLETEFSNEVESFTEISKAKWLEIEKNTSPFLRRSPFSLFGAPSKSDSSPEARAKSDVEERKNEYLAAALSALVVNGEPTDCQFGRKYLAHDNYDVQLEAVKIVRRFGDKSDVAALMEIAKTTEGILQETSAQAVIKLAGDTTKSATGLLRTADEILISILITHFLSSDGSFDVEEFLEPFLDDSRTEVRIGVLIYFLEKYSEKELESLLIRYTSKETYFYDVVCWLDRILYAPDCLKAMYRQKLSRKILKI